MIRYLLFLIGLIYTPLCFGQSWKKQFGGYLKPEKDHLPIEMKLEKTSDSIFGTYYYVKYGKDMRLKGTLTGSKINLKEYNAKEKHTGTFSGTYYIKGDSLKGTWMNVKGDVKIPFLLQGEEWCDYKLVFHKLEDNDEDYEWYEMKELPDSGIQKTFNNIEENITKELSVKPSWGPGAMDDSVIYTAATWATLTLQNNYLISLGFFHSDYVGGMGAWNHSNHYNFDLTSGENVSLDHLLKTDTAAFDILMKWIKTALQNRGDWDYFVEDYEADYLTEKNFYAEMYFQPDGVYFFFPRPGAITNILGLQDVRISYRNFVKIIRKESVVYRWIVETGRNK